MPRAAQDQTCAAMLRADNPGGAAGTAQANAVGLTT
jgi:hypothetical protein